MERLQLEREFIRSPRSWMRPYIQVARPRNKQPNFGVMIPSNEVTVFEDDMRTPIKTYSSLEALQEDGWSTI